MVVVILIPAYFLGRPIDYTYVLPPHFTFHSLAAFHRTCVYAVTSGPLWGSACVYHGLGWGKRDLSQTCGDPTRSVTKSKRFRLF